jgi:hypothetical protein
MLPGAAQGIFDSGQPEGDVDQTFRIDLFARRSMDWAVTATPGAAGLL